ncbi:Hsp20 family protein [Lyngbya aestuarii]|uniref:Hsp20 family protein n=1 Tax=Lyngbya aestuarii TaxID=118322 RepID=UPI00403DC94C
MAIIHWQPFQDREIIRRHLDKMFDEATDLHYQPPTTWQPAIEMQTTDDNLILRAEIPGIEGKDLDVRVTREAVVISGEYHYKKPAQQKGIFHSEFRYGKFRRGITLPVAVQNNQVKADFTNGILTLTLPKVEAAKNRVVKVKLTDSTLTTPVSKESVANTETDDVWESQTAEPVAV